MAGFGVQVLIWGIWGIGGVDDFCIWGFLALGLLFWLCLGVSIAWLAVHHACGPLTV